MIVVQSTKDVQSVTDRTVPEPAALVIAEVVSIEFLGQGPKHLFQRRHEIGRDPISQRMDPENSLSGISKIVGIEGGQRKMARKAHTELDGMD